MATGHYITNRGKFLIASGNWVDNAAGTLRLGYIQATPSAFGAFNATQTAAAVAQYDFVSEMIAAGGTLATFTNYATFALTSPGVTEQDTANDRVVFTASTSPWTIASAGSNTGGTNNTLHGVFVYQDLTTTDTAANTAKSLISIDFFASSITTNGGSLSYAWTNIYTLA